MKNNKKMNAILLIDDVGGDGEKVYISKELLM